MNAVPGPDDALVRVKADALRLLAARPRSVAELRERLALKKHEAARIDAVLAELSRLGMLDDAKFAKLVAGSIARSKPSGRRRIEADLRRKGVPAPLIAKAIEEVGGDEKQAARDAVSARFHRMTGVPPEKKKARLFGFLKRRGFGTETSLAVLSELFKDGEGTE